MSHFMTCLAISCHILKPQLPGNLGISFEYVTTSLTYHQTRYVTKLSWFLYQLTERSVSDKNNNAL